MSMTTELAQTKELAFLMSERFTMNPISCKHLNEAWREAFPDEVAVAKRMLALVEALEISDKQIAKDVQIKARLCRESNSLHDRLREAENRIAELEFAQSLHDEGTGMLCGQFDELAAAMGWTSELAEKQGVSQLEYARGLKLRIAELEARTVKLPLPRRKNADDYIDDTFEPCDLAAIYNACRLECEVKFKKALDAAGVAVERN